ncbi:MAG: hypothetical protein WBX01_17985 [Nitrososphaeraceae archaeon]
MNNQKTRNMAIVAAVAALLLATTAISATSHNVFATYKRNQATSQANACGNEFLPTNVGCQNTGSQIQGDENGVALAAQQTFPEVDMQKDHKKVRPIPPPPPSATACERAAPTYAWDITIKALHEGQSPGEDVPIGTIVCIYQGLGNHEATVIEPVAGGEPEVYNANVNTDQPNANPQCNGNDQQLAEVTSDNGGLPNNVALGDMLCATVGSPIVM